MPTPTPPAAYNLTNLGGPVVAREYIWRDFALRAWGAEFYSPDHGAYRWSNGRQFDSTDRGTTGVYNPNLS